MMLRRAVLRSCAALALFAAGLGVCAAQPPSPAPTTPKVIAASLLTMQHGFYQELRAGLEEEAAKHGYKLVVLSAEFDSSRQANQIDDFIQQKVSAIIVSPCDSRSVGTSIKAANDAGILVVTADIASLAKTGKVASHIASDNVAGGKAAAGLMADALKGKGKVAVLSHPEVASVSDRVKGFREAIKSSKDITIVAELSSEGKRDKAVRVMEDLMQSEPGLAGVFCINDDTALGALAAVEAAGKQGKIAIIGYDGTPEARAKIKSGGIYGDVVQNPRRIGVLTIGAVHDLLTGKTPPPPAVIPVEVGTITRKDL